MSVTLKIIASTGDRCEITIDDSQTVLQLKHRIQEKLPSLPVAYQRLIHKGRPMNDPDPICNYAPMDGDNIHLVKSMSAAPPPAAPRPSTSPLSRPAANPMAAMMDNPIMQSMLSNPDMMRELMMMNPSMREAINRNPELEQIMSDPHVLRQAMSAMRNPGVMQEMTRNTDRAIQNLDAVPGGMDALARMYNEVQRPLEDATLGLDRDDGTATSSTSSNTTAAPRPPPSGPPNSEPLPNPWARPAAGYGGMGGFGGMGGMGGGMGGMDLASAMNNPMVQQMSQQMMQNPQLMQQMLASMGMGGGAGGGTTANPFAANPFGSAFGANTNINNAFTNGALFEQGLQGGNRTTATASASPLTTTPAATTASVATSSTSKSASEGDAFETQFGTSKAASASSDLAQTNPTEFYKEEIAELQEMGFEDTDVVIQALRDNNGNVALALETLLGTRL